MKNNALKLLSLALIVPLMTACPKKKDDPLPPPPPAPNWSVEIQEDMELYMGTTLPYLELNEETIYHGYDDSNEGYGVGTYVIGDDNEENIIANYGDLLVEDGWVFVEDDEGDYYKKEVDDFELMCFYDFYEATDEYEAGNEIVVYCPVYVPPVTEEALLAAGYTKVQGWPAADVLEVLTDTYNIGALNATGEWFTSGVILETDMFGDQYNAIYLATYADVTEAAIETLTENGYYYDEDYDSYWSSDDEAYVELGINNGFTLINIYGPYLQPEEGEVVSEVDNNNGTVTVTYTFTGNLIDATDYGGRTFESASCNLTLAQGGNQNNAPKYYDNGNALRVYFKNTLTLQAASGCEIVSATVSIGSVNKITVNDLSANAGSVSLSGSNAPAVATISGVNASSLTITVAPEGTKGNLGITSVSVVIASVR